MIVAMVVKCDRQAPQRLPETYIANSSATSLEPPAAKIGQPLASFIAISIESASTIE